MIEARKLTKAELEYYVSAKPRTEKLPGFFDEAGKLHRGAYYLAYLVKLSLALLIGMTTSACAGWCDPTKDECWPRTDPPKQVRAWVKHAPARVIVKRDVILKVEGVDEPGTCRPSVSVVGDEARSKEAAELQARQHFMKTVRFHHGEKFIEIGNARDVFFQCSRSDFPISGGKVGAALDAVSHSWRCSIKATPCAQSIVREEK